MNCGNELYGLERWMDGLEKVEQERRAGVDKIRHEQEERIRMGWIKAIIKPLSLSPYLYLR